MLPRVYLVTVTRRDSAQFLNALETAADEGEMQDPFEVALVNSFDKVLLSETRNF
jgi:hypothetical protein